MIDRRVEDWCVQAMTVQEFKPRGGSEEQPSNDILYAPSPEVLDNEKESAQGYRSQDSENLLGRVLAGEPGYQLFIYFLFIFFFVIKNKSYIK